MYSIVALAAGITAIVLFLFGMMQIGLYLKVTTEMSRADLLAGTWGTVAWVLLPGLGLLIGAHGLPYLLMGRLNEEQETGPAGRVLSVIVIAVMTIQLYVGILLFVHFGRVES